MALSKVCTPLEHFLSSTRVFKRYFGLATRQWEHKRFYKQAQIYETEDDQYGVKLDHRNLRTPLRKLFVVPTKSLAVAVAQEWQAQSTVIQSSLMHLTSLCNTVMDNPLKINCKSVTQNLLYHLSTETICFRATEPEDLVEMQQKEWDPLLLWFNQRYSGTLQPTSGLGLEPQTNQLKKTVSQYTMGLDKWGLIGINYALECCKSSVIACALFEGKLDPYEACQLSRLEVRHQTNKWGTLEWQHDIDHMDLISRLSASLLLYQLSRQ